MSMVLELQQSIYNKTASTSEVLLKAYTISRKLNLTDITELLKKEMEGYKERELPNYRIAIGIIEVFNPYNGWIPVIFKSREEQNQSEKIYFRDSILELETIMDNSKDGVIYLTTPATERLKNRLKTDVMIKTSKAKIQNILGRINNIILEWTLCLEERGILGENMQFTKKEKEEAKTVTIMNINGDNTKINNNSIDNSKNIK